MDADEIIEKLGLQPHPEGGYFRETFRDQAGGERAYSTAIYYLFRRGERSHWHRVDAAEVWHWYAGAPFRLSQSAEPGVVTDAILGTDLIAGERPQIMVPAGVWQGGETLGEWTLGGCTVAPAFQFAGFELAPEGWSP